MRGTFHALKRVKANVIGDIGCYTLGCMPPLQSVDTTICMGAGIGMTIGMEKVRGKEFAKKQFPSSEIPHLSIPASPVSWIWFITKPLAPA